MVDRVGLALGEGITGWVAAHNEPVAISAKASDDRRFTKLENLPEDRREAFLSVPVLCRRNLVGVINVQHRAPHSHTRREIKLITTLGYLVGAEIELARMEFEKSQLSDQLETRKLMERAKGILQRDMGLDEETAYIALQKQSRQRRKPLREIAEAIIHIHLVQATIHPTLALAHVRHLDGEAMVTNAKLFASAKVVHDFRAVDNVLAWKARNIGTRAANILAINDCDALPFAGKRPGSNGGARAATENHQIKFFRLRLLNCLSG
jgi:hypothetical protein